jgi:hypothetical protein
MIDGVPIYSIPYLSYVVLVMSLTLLGEFPDVSQQKSVQLYWRHVYFTFSEYYTKSDYSISNAVSYGDQRKHLIG